MAKFKKKSKEILDYRRLLFLQLNRIAQLSVTMSGYTKENLQKLKNSILILESYLKPYLGKDWGEKKKKILSESIIAGSNRELFRVFRSLLDELVNIMDEKGLLLIETIEEVEA